MKLLQIKGEILLDYLQVINFHEAEVIHKGLFLEMGYTEVFCKNYFSRLSFIKIFTEDLLSTINKSIKYSSY